MPVTQVPPLVRRLVVQDVVQLQRVRFPEVDRLLHLPLRLRVPQLVPGVMTGGVLPRLQEFLPGPPVLHRREVLLPTVLYVLHLRPQVLASAKHQPRLLLRRVVAGVVLLLRRKTVLRTVGHHLHLRTSCRFSSIHERLLCQTHMDSRKFQFVCPGTCSTDRRVGVAG